jgi:Iap family predicted aminopeptidase
MKRHLNRSLGLLVGALLLITWAPAGSPIVAQTTGEERDEARASLSLGERALSVVRVLGEDIGSRPAGTEAERKAATYLAEELTAMGYAVDVVPFDYTARSESGTSQNVVARDPQEDPGLPLVIIGAHYDSVPMGPGANDNGSGTALTVEVARELRWFPVPGVAVRFVAFGAEEVGLRGSAQYVRTLSPADVGRTRVAMSLDMLAVGTDPAFAGSDPWVSEAMARAASQGYTPVDLSRPLRRMSDHASFLDAGIPAILFHWVDDPFYHTAFDLADHVQFHSLDLMGAIAIELVRAAAR